MLSGMSRLFLWACLAVGVAIIPASPSYAREPTLLTPTSPWHLDYSDDSCSLARTFGEDDRAITMIMRRFQPGELFRMVLVGPSLRRAPQERELTLQFGPDEAEQEIGFFPGNVGELPALILHGDMRIAPLTDSETSEVEALWESDEGHLFDYPAIDNARENAVTYLFFNARGVPATRLEMDAFGEAFAAFDTCIDELLTHWGIDVARHQNLTRPATPRSSPGRWITPSEYPRNMLRRGGQAILNFRLDVDEMGEVTGCHIQRRTRPDEFADIVCASLMERAEFDPALDADGVPIASYYASTVRFQTY